MERGEGTAEHQHIMSYLRCRCKERTGRLQTQEQRKTRREQEGSMARSSPLPEFVLQSNITAQAVPPGRAGQPPPDQGSSVPLVMADHLDLCKDLVCSFYQQKRLPRQLRITNCLFGQTEVCDNGRPRGERKREGILPGRLHNLN